MHCLVKRRRRRKGRTRGTEVVDINEKKEEEDVDISSKDRGTTVQRGSGYK